jgi:adenylate cyclase
LLSVLVHFFEHGRWGSPVESGVEGQNLTAEDQLFVLMQAALYLTATRGLASPEAKVCYERAESLCHSLNRPLLLCSTLLSQWRYSFVTEKLTATLQIAERIYSLAQGQNDPAPIMGACTALAATHCYLGDDFKIARQYALRGVEVWRSGGVQTLLEEQMVSPVVARIYEALSEWYLGEVISSQTSIAEAISLAKELNDMSSLAFALYFGGILARFERNPAEVERLASELIELSTRYNFAFWLPGANVLRGWARVVCGDTAAGISLIGRGVEDYRATGSIAGLPMWVALKAEALYLADRTSEALETIRGAEALAERFEVGWWYAELRRLRGVFLAATGAEETRIEPSFQEAINIAREQKAISIEKRTEVSYAEYRRRKASALEGQEIRLPI